MWEWLFGRRRARDVSRSATASIDLPFKDAAGFFEYQCKFSDSDLRSDHIITAIVLDARIEAGTKVAVKTVQDGNQLAMVRIAAVDGGFGTVAFTQNPGDPIYPGDLVLWRAGKQLEFALTDDARSSWCGLIVAKIAPVLQADGHYRVIHDYRVPVAHEINLR